MDRIIARDARRINILFGMRVTCVMDFDLIFAIICSWERFAARAPRYGLQFGSEPRAPSRRVAVPSAELEARRGLGGVAWPPPPFLQAAFAATRYSGRLTRMRLMVLFIYATLLPSRSTSRRDGIILAKVAFSACPTFGTNVMDQEICSNSFLSLTCIVLPVVELHRRPNIFSNAMLRHMSAAGPVIAPATFVVLEAHRLDDAPLFQIGHPAFYLT